MIGEGTKIGVKVSLGLTEEEMPNVVGKSENAAIEAITRLVGDVAEIRYVHDADAKPSEVIKQLPPQASLEGATEPLVAEGALNLF